MNYSLVTSFSSDGLEILANLKARNPSINFSLNFYVNLIEFEEKISELRYFSAMAPGSIDERNFTLILGPASLPNSMFQSHLNFQLQNSGKILVSISLYNPVSGLSNLEIFDGCTLNVGTDISSLERFATEILRALSVGSGEAELSIFEPYECFL